MLYLYYRDVVIPDLIRNRLSTRNSRNTIVYLNTRSYRDHYHCKFIMLALLSIIQLASTDCSCQQAQPLWRAAIKMPDQICKGFGRKIMSSKRPVKNASCAA